MPTLRIGPSIKARRHELLKGVPTSTPTLLDVDLDRTDPTWPHVDLDPRRPDMYYYLQQLQLLFIPSKPGVA